MEETTERLTMRDVGGRALWVSPQSPGGGYRLSEDMEDQRRLDRLAAYEDTGLKPEEIEEAKDRTDLKFALWVSKVWGLADGRLNEILKAEKDGRLVVLPSKIGDVIYEANKWGLIST